MGLSSAMNEMFGERPNRPDHPDLWRLSEIALAIDAGMSEAEDKDAQWSSVVEKIIDQKSLIYHAMQRASRLFDVETVADLARHRTEVLMYTVVWCEGFLTGAQFQDRGGHQ